MSDLAIRVENLSKQYKIGATIRHDRLKDLLTSGLNGLFRRSPSPVSGPSSSRCAVSGLPSSEYIWALEDVSFEVKQGEVLGIIGPNGAGKSTLLRILSRITEPTSGRAEIYGRVGSLLEIGTGFDRELTGRENIYLNGAIMGMTKREIDRKFEEIVDFSGVETFIETPVKHYSSGMYVRLAFAVAAHLEPEILIVDEVLAVGDAAFQKKCLAKMQKVGSGGRTVLFVSHNMAAILSLCSKCLLLEKGRLREVGNTAAAVERYQSNSGHTISVPLAERKDRRGNGALRFSKLSFTRDARVIANTAPASGEPASITMECRSTNGKALNNVTIDIRIVDSHGNFLFTCSTTHQRSCFDQIPPLNKIACNIPRLPLLPGVYRIDLWSAVRGEEADYIEDAGRFTVMEGDYFGSGRLPRASVHGPVLVNHSWSISIPHPSAEELT